MRCQICDYCTTANSDFNKGLAREKSGFRGRVSYDTLSGMYLCTDCKGATYDKDWSLEDLLKEAIEEEETTNEY